MPYKHGVTGSSPVVPTNKKAHQDDVLFLLYGTIYGREPNRTGWRSAVACNRLRYAPCVTLQTLCVALLFILDLHYAEHALLSHVVCFAFEIALLK